MPESRSSGPRRSPSPFRGREEEKEEEEEEEEEEEGHSSTPGSRLPARGTVQHPVYEIEK